MKPSHIQMENTEFTVKGGGAHNAGFTLTELLTVIAIIAVLAALLMPALSAAKTHAKIAQAKLEISQISTAIISYDSTYGRFPVSPQAQATAALYQTKNQNPDFTYGGIPDSNPNPSFPVIGTFYRGQGSVPATNAEVIAILMNITNFPNTTTPTINTNSWKNPQQTIFLSAKMSGDTSSPGVGTDLVYRDPWGNPYVITMDLSYDGYCEDSFYSLTAVSNPGLNGLVLMPKPNPNTYYGYTGKVMVWSAGPDGKVDSSAAANQGFNKDNILSWQ